MTLLMGNYESKEISREAICLTNLCACHKTSTDLICGFRLWYIQIYHIGWVGQSHPSPNRESKWTKLFVQVDVKMHAISAPNDGINQSLNTNFFQVKLVCNFSFDFLTYQILLLSYTLDKLFYLKTKHFL